jgi:hypothetical protein
MTSIQKLLNNIKDRDWSSANEQFAGIMQQKVADRLQVERQVLGRTLVKEDEDKVETKDSRCPSCHRSVKTVEGKGFCRHCRQSVELDEETINEETPPGQEAWVKANKARFKKEYGDKKGTEVLYATAWRNAKK